MDNSRQLYKGAIDGGYLSWVFGTRPGYGGWAVRRFDFQGYLLVMDGRQTWRQQYYPEYKSRRRKKRREHPEQAARREKVLEFQGILRMDPVVPTASFPECEADDLLALLFLQGRVPQVVAVDKDLYQVPRLRDQMVNHRLEKSSREGRRPQYARRPTTPHQFCLEQTLFGDRSDSVPRLLPSQGYTAKKLHRYILDPQDPLREWIRGYKLYGEALLRNLYLILMPGPFLRKDWELLKGDPMQLMREVAQGTYWTPEKFIDPMVRIRKEWFEWTHRSW